HWLLVWLLVVFAGSALKPDHDIRYLYPALPVLGFFSALAITTLTQNRLPTFVPGIILFIVVIILIIRYEKPGQVDTRETIEAIRADLMPGAPILAIGGYPVRLDKPRRQNTHRDWVHFYIGSAPMVMSWDQVRKNRPDFSNGVFLTNSRGHVERLAELQLDAKHVTTEMIFARPK
ncbi:MAG TPA: hypothetical protein DGR97_05710, partial [Gammaproteobacteria bacterium]|nr:hypothetical protein [Gammaproteobacteria bacterium]